MKTKENTSQLKYIIISHVNAQFDGWIIVYIFKNTVILITLQGLHFSNVNVNNKQQC